MKKALIIGAAISGIGAARLLNKYGYRVYLTDAKEIKERKELENTVQAEFKSKIGITIIPKAVSMMELPRSEKKSHRIFDNRY